MPVRPMQQQPFRLNQQERRLLRGGSAWLDEAKTELDEEALLERWAAALARRGEPGSPESVAVYVHVPYCRSRCTYCKEPSYRCNDPRQFSHYVDYVGSRLGRVRERLGRVRANSLYIGGGTPSLLPVDQLRRLLQAIQRTFAIDGEASFEANPESFSDEKLFVVRQYGINRISLGVQSTNPAVLSAIARNNPPKESIERRVGAAMATGAVVNVDLMIGLPAQSAADVVCDIDWAMQAGPHSISLYRYQRQPGSAATPSRLVYRDLPWSRLVARSLARGYLPGYSIARAPNSISFVRPALLLEHTTRSAAPRLDALAQLFRANAMGRQLPAHTGLAHYAVFDVSPVHIMGFGPSAISRLFGCGWYRDDTPALRCHGTAPAQYVGERIAMETELARAIAGDLAANRWVRCADYRAATGLDPLELLGELPTALWPALQRSRRRLRLRTKHPAAEGVLRWLLLKASA